MLHPFYMLLGVVGYIVFLYMAFLIVDRKFFRVDSKNVASFFLAVNSFLGGTYFLVLTLLTLNLSVLFFVVIAYILGFLFWKRASKQEEKYNG